MKAKLTQRDIDDYRALPVKERIKAWHSYTRLVEAGELEPFGGLIKPPDAEQ
jgi:hypothetical protein